jgi:hypothetical protein
MLCTLANQSGDGYVHAFPDGKELGMVVHQKGTTAQLYLSREQVEKLAKYLALFLEE